MGAQNFLGPGIGVGKSPIAMNSGCEELLNLSFAYISGTASILFLSSTELTEN